MMLALAGGLAAQDNSSTTAEQQAPTASAVQAGEAALQAAESDGAAPGDSHVRIVRLSQAQGTLTMDRGTGKGFEQTMQNMPIVEGSRLQTDDGYAEVEFEDGSSLRLTPDSRVAFSQLVLRGSGAKASTVTVERGTVYVSLENTKGNEFTVKAGQATMTVEPSTHMRVEITWPKMVLSVFSGNVALLSGGATTMVGKKESATLDATDPSKVETAKKIAEAAYDGWDKEAVDYHKRYAKGNAFAGGGYGYGVTDLNYYGGFVNGCGGTFWQPYFVSAGWDPYGNGVWAWYPGAGYSWVSPYPWGWLPYHSGSWAFCPGMGWGWQPGNDWRGLVNVTPYPVKPGQDPLRHGPPHPPGPARPPVAPKSTLVMANRAPLVISKENTPGNFVFQKDSAGLGVPRGSLGNLNKISNGVEQHGFVNRQVYAESMVRGGTSTPEHPMHQGPVALRQGSPRGDWQGVEGSHENQNHSGAASNAGGANASAGLNRGGANAGASNGGGGMYHGGGGGGGSIGERGSHSGGGGGMSGGGNTGGSSGAPAGGGSRTK